MDPTNEHENASAISSDLIRGHINTIILRTLYDGDKYGYEIINEIEEKSKGQYSLKQPTLYSALKRLESQDYVTSYWGGVSNGGRRKYFQITDKGKKVVEQNLAEWEYSRTVIDSLISEKDYDFNNPPPSAVDFSLLKKSTTRVSAAAPELGHDDIDLAPYEEAAPADEPPAQKDDAPLAELPSETEAETVTPAEDAGQDAAEETAQDAAEETAQDAAADELDEAPAPSRPAMHLESEAPKTETKVSAAESTASSAASTRVSDAPAFARSDDTDENGERTKPFGGSYTWVDQEQRRIQHENYRNLVGDDDDANSFYYEQVARNNRAGDARASSSSARTSSSYTNPSYYNRDDAYGEDTYRGEYGDDYSGDAFMENRAISSELLYSNRSPAERNYKELLTRLYDNSARQVYYPDQEEEYYPEENYGETQQPAAEAAQPDDVAQPARSAPQEAAAAEAPGDAAMASNVEFYDIEERAESDGIRVMTSNGSRNRTVAKSYGNTFDKGKALFMSALCVFVIALVESVINLCIRNVIHAGTAYVVIPFVCAFVMFGVFLFLYLRGFGKNSRKTQSRSYLSASLILFANLVVIVCVIAYLLIINSDAAVSFLQILKYAILPCVFAFNIPVFAFFYNYHSNRQ